MRIEDIFNYTPASQFELRKQNAHIYQLIAPIFHDDGDMMSIFLEEDGDNVKISDNGISLMRLSYTFDIDTDNKRKQLDRIIKVQDASNENGNIVLTVPQREVYSGIMSFAQMISQVCNLDILSHETITDLFYEDLEVALASSFTDYKFEKDYINPKYQDLKIDYALLDREKPVYLFGAKDTNKAQQITICCLMMMKKDISFKSIAIFNDIDGIQKFARNNLMNTASKVFSDVPGFLESGPDYFKNEFSIVA
jgi:hypothetical protein